VGSQKVKIDTTRTTSKGRGGGNISEKKKPTSKSRGRKKRAFLKGQWGGSNRGKVRGGGIKGAKKGVSAGGV